MRLRPGAMDIAGAYQRNHKPVSARTFAVIAQYGQMSSGIAQIVRKTIGVDTALSLSRTISDSERRRRRDSASICATRV